MNAKGFVKRDASFREPAAHLVSSPSQLPQNNNQRCQGLQLSEFMYAGSKQ
jgi:hypothetical protein